MRFLGARAVCAQDDILTGLFHFCGSPVKRVIGCELRKAFMIRPIMTKKFFLRQQSDLATVADVQVARDLVDTLQAHRATCVGMAANMIGERKRIIAVVDDDGFILVMFNPRLVRSSDPYETEEGCLSLPGTRPTRRFERILVSYEDEFMQSCQVERTGRVAQAIQHEIDHCDGVLI